MLHRKDVVLAVREGIESIGFQFKRRIAYNTLRNGFQANIDPHPAGRGYTSFTIQIGVSHQGAFQIAESLAPGTWFSGPECYGVSDFAITQFAHWSVDHDSPEQIPVMVSRIHKFIEEEAMPWMDSLASWDEIVQIEDNNHLCLPIVQSIGYAYFLDRPEMALEILKNAPHNDWEMTMPKFREFRRNLEKVIRIS
jgi:hypothetical protein